MTPYEGLSDDDVAELAASNRLRNLRGIDLGWNQQLGPRNSLCLRLTLSPVRLPFPHRKARCGFRGRGVRLGHPFCLDVKVRL